MKNGINRNKLPIIGIDIDGVICDLVSGIIPIINNTFACNLKRDDIRMFEMDKSTGVSYEEFSPLFKKIDYSKLPMMSSANAIINKLHKYYYIKIVTSRPKELHKATLKWLGINRIEYDQYSEDNHSKNDVTKAIPLKDCQIIIDDDLRVVISEGSKGKKAILFNSPWNHSINAKNLFIRCNDWQEIKKQIHP